MNARILPFLLALSVTAASTGLVTAQEANGLRAQGIVEIDTGSAEAQGISHLYDQGFDVFRIIQTSDGSYVFHASSGAYGRVLVLDAGGEILSDDVFETETDAGTIARI